MRSNGRGGRWVAVVIGALLAAVGLVSTGSAEQSLLTQASAEQRLLTRASTGPRGGNGDFDARFRGASADGTRTFFVTKERLVRSADTDSRYDVYRRSGTHTRLISTGPTGGNGPVDSYFVGASADGTRVFLNTYESLVSADTDSAKDVYERAAGQTTLISTGPTGGNGGFHSFFTGASADGERVFFETNERLVSGDTDTWYDVYERADGQTTLISTGPTVGNGPIPSHFTGATADGTRVFFETGEQLVSADTDSTLDVYERAGGQTTLISTGPTDGNDSTGSWFSGASADGTRVFFTTGDRLVSADTDSEWDVYERAGGQTTLISTGPTGGNGDIGDLDAAFMGASADGTRVFFRTDEQLVSADTDSEWDVYERSGGQTTLISIGPTGGNADIDAAFQDASADGTRVFFTTYERLVSADTDSEWDVYERASGQTTLISTGPTGGNGPFRLNFLGASADGTRVFLETGERLVSADTDSAWDVYERASGQTTLISIGPTGGNGDIASNFEGASADGTRVFFETYESLRSGDTDQAEDVYVSRTVAP